MCIFTNFKEQDNLISPGYFLQRIKSYSPAKYRLEQDRSCPAEDENAADFYGLFAMLLFGNLFRNFVPSLPKMINFMASNTQLRLLFDSKMERFSAAEVDGSHSGANLQCKQRRVQLQMQSYSISQLDTDAPRLRICTSTNQRRSQRTANNRRRRFFPRQRWRLVGMPDELSTFN